MIIHGYCTVGDECIIRQGITLGNPYLDKPLESPQLGDRVNVGVGANILGKVNLGDDVNIGANAVVLSDIPAGQTVIAIPTKIIKSRPDEHNA